MEWSIIAIFYFACLSFGFLFALLGAVFGEIFGHAETDIGGHEVGVGHAEVDAAGHEVDLGHGGAEGHDVHVGTHVSDMPGANFFNMITIATFCGFLGIIGLALVWGLHVGALPSLAISVPAALVIAALQFVLYVRIFIEAQGSSEATLSETLGCEADVITTIPASSVGEIAYVIKGTRYSAPASSADGADIARGTRVQVVNMKGSTFIVRPL